MERELLYAEKTSLQDFLKGNALNLELHHLYKHYLANNKKASMCKCTEIKVLNEVYRQYALLHGSKPRTYTTLKMDMSYVRYWFAKGTTERRCNGVRGMPIDGHTFRSTYALLI